jgi:hypothetical protein
VDVISWVEIAKDLDLAAKIVDRGLYKPSKKMSKNINIFIMIYIY